MVQQSPPASTSGTGTASGDVRLSGGVIATLAGSGLLIVFMLQNTQDVTLEFLFWGLTGHCGCSPWSTRRCERSCGSGSACCAGIVVG